MILVDERIGSASLAGHLRHWHFPVDDSGRLDFGDAAFAGNGPAGPSTVACGIEIKAVRDALNCMSDGRFAGHQLPGLVQTYDRVWLVVEGWYRPDFGTGVLLEPPRKRAGARELTLGTRRFMYRDLDHWLATMEEMAGIRVRRTGDRTETARVVADLYTWWTAKDYTQHNSHRALHSEQGRPDVALFSKPPLRRVFAADIPGIGFKKSQAVMRKFDNSREMVNASKDQWAEIDGIGETLASRIHDILGKE